MSHRPPTASDIGKTVEVRRGVGGEWETITLAAIEYVDTNGAILWEECRVPYSTPDPIAELSIAADLCMDYGMEEAARVLMAEIEKRKPLDISQIPVERLFIG